MSEPHLEADRIAQEHTGFALIQESGHRTVSAIYFFAIIFYTLNFGLIKKKQKEMGIQEYPYSMLAGFAPLFYVCKLFGVVPHSFTEFYNRKRMQVSNFGILMTVAMIALFGAGSHYLIMNMTDSSSGKDGKSGSALTTVIGLVLNYIAPLMMIVDLCSWIFNRQKVIDLFEEYNIMDINLFKQGITVNNDRMRLRIFILIAVTFLSELTITCLTYYIFKDLLTFMYFISFFPTFLSALDKIWFASLLFSLKQRFAALNSYIDQTVEDYNKFRKIKDNYDDLNNDMKHIGLLHKEILTRNFVNNAFSASGKGAIGFKSFDIKNNSRVVPVVPWNDKLSGLDFKVRKADKFTILQSRQNILNDLDSLEDKLNNLCRLHDEMCEIGKTINGMWSIQMLLLMAYGFMSITAQFYFLYCSMTDQIVPQLFISSENLSLSCIFVVYVAMKCVYVIFLSWQTRLESRRTGVCVHKCALAIDENNIYEIVNHISLKLMNHAVDFSACGFFNLDMTTLYAVTGAITSYLIILIQFNLAARQTQSKTAVVAGTTTNRALTTASILLGNVTTTTPRPSG